MTGVSLPIEIPKRTLFKAAEVCDLVKVQPYVLRSWEGEFPELGVATTAGGPRVYRRTDVEQVMRIKHLLLVEGLTLAGARRKLEEEGAPPIAVEELIGPEARNRLTEIKRGLRSILDLLSTPAPTTGLRCSRRRRRSCRLRTRSPRRASPALAEAVIRRRNGPRGAGSDRRRDAGLPAKRVTRSTDHLPSGRSVAWLSRLTGGQEIGGSNPPVPTSFPRPVTPG